MYPSCNKTYAYNTYIMGQRFTGYKKGENNYEKKLKKSNVCRNILRHGPVNDCLQR
jgi:hypothetical protein